MSNPYRGTVNCFWCMAEDKIEIPAFGVSDSGHYACSQHINLLLIAGMYDRPLPEMDESIRIMQEGLNPDDF